LNAGLPCLVSKWVGFRLHDWQLVGKALQATHNVIRETTRRSTTNPDAEDLAPEQLIKAYKVLR
jgi:hypothetical protein